MQVNANTDCERSSDNRSAQVLKHRWRSLSHCTVVRERGGDAVDRDAVCCLTRRERVRVLSNGGANTNGCASTDSLLEKFVLAKGRYSLSLLPNSGYFLSKSMINGRTVISILSRIPNQFRVFEGVRVDFKSRIRAEILLHCGARIVRRRARNVCPVIFSDLVTNLYASFRRVAINS